MYIYVSPNKAISHKTCKSCCCEKVRVHCVCDNCEGTSAIFLPNQLFSLLNTLSVLSIIISLHVRAMLVNDYSYPLVAVPSNQPL